MVVQADSALYALEQLLDWAAPKGEDWSNSFVDEEAVVRDWLPAGAPDVWPADHSRDHSHDEYDEFQRQLVEDAARELGLRADVTLDGGKIVVRLLDADAGFEEGVRAAEALSAAETDGDFTVDNARRIIAAWID